MRALENPEKWSELMYLMDVGKYDEAREICKAYSFDDGTERRLKVKKKNKSKFRAVYYIKNGKTTYFKSISLASKATGVDRSTVYNCAKKNTKMRNGDAFKYVEEKPNEPK